MSLASSLDLSSYTSASLDLWRYIDDGFDAGEYLKLEVYDGTSWSVAFEKGADTGDDDDAWHCESYAIPAGSLVDGFNLRLTAKTTYITERVMLDDVKIVAESTCPVPVVLSTTLSEDFESGLTAWTQSGDSDWITRTATPAIPDSTSGNLVAYSSDCDTTCMITLASPIDLSARQSGYLTLDRFVGSSFDTSEYLKIELRDGGNIWNTVDIIRN